MIDELHLRDLGVIEDATLELGPGLTVVTGETGAGKTMVVSALELLCGARADAGLVRSGAAAALVEARFVPAPGGGGDRGSGGRADPPAAELVVSRELKAAGGSRARVDGRLAPVAALTEQLGAAVEVHGQSAHARLDRPETQRELLDRYAGGDHLDAVAAYRRTHRAWREATDRRERLRDEERHRARTLDRLRHEVAEIERAALDPEADAAVADEIELLTRAEEVRAALHGAAAALDDEGAGAGLGAAVDAVRSARNVGRTAPLRQRVEALAIEAAELVRDLRAEAEGLDLDPARLEELRGREQLIRGLQRKYGADIDEVLAYAAAARADLGRLEADEDAAARTDAEVARLEATVRETGAALTAGRVAAGRELARVVESHLDDLAFPRARFEVAVTSSDVPRATGMDEVRFLLAPNVGEPARDLGRCASGGERSRVALAVETALATADDVTVLVFDEVDAGIGGATALAVGRKLADLARGRPDRQVLCVTHLGQVAAFADHHHVVHKRVVDGRTVTSARRVTGEERVTELARMLGGDAQGASARAHAAELLARAQRGVATGGA